MNIIISIIFSFFIIIIADFQNIKSNSQKHINDNHKVNNESGCKSDKITGEITVKILKGGKKVVNAHYLRYKTTRKSTISNPLVISVAYGYRWNKLGMFVKSLRKSGYKGSLIMLNDMHYNESYLTYCFNKYNVTLLHINNKWPFYSDLNSKYPIDRNNLNECMLKENDYSIHKWSVYRFSLIYCFLRKYGYLFSAILHVDCRDIVFQKNPFEWNVESNLYLVEETDGDYYIKKDRFNLEWVEAYENASFVHKCRALNSGIILGSTNVFLKFLKRYVKYMKQKYIKTNEQGTLNYLFYTQDWTDLPILINRNGYGFALNLAVDLLCIHDNSFFPHSDMYVHNKDGTIPCIVHQYDRNMMKYKDWMILRSET